MEEPTISDYISRLNTTSSQTVICPVCKGEGLLQSRKFYGHTDGWWPINSTCPECHGRRILKRTVTITYDEI